jgi:hypothetical protein
MALTGAAKVEVGIEWAACVVARVLDERLSNTSGLLSDFSAGVIKIGVGEAQSGFSGVDVKISG